MISFLHEIFSPPFYHDDGLILAPAGIAFDLVNTSYIVHFWLENVLHDGKKNNEQVATLELYDDA